MRIVRSVSEVRAAVRSAGGSVGLVPTMGALHDGHLALVRAARERTDLVVVSLFVNPTQFNEGSDLAAYPRDEARDTELAEQAGADVLFAPSVGTVYPAGFATSIRIDSLTEQLEGAHRGREHFDGVATVVTKLFNMVGPDVAFFGEKDAQQLAVIKKLVRDLDMPVEIVGVPTVREADGLAMSSRNVRLEQHQRGQALSLIAALRSAESAAHDGERDASAVRDQALAAMRSAGVEPEYLELVSPDTFVPVSQIDGDVLVAVAARVGDTRLIDNTLIRTNGGTPE